MALEELEALAGRGLKKDAEGGGVRGAAGAVLLAINCVLLSRSSF